MTEERKPKYKIKARLKKLLNNFIRFFYAETNEACLSPWYHGFAWSRYERRTTITIILPLNILVGILRQFFFAARRFNVDAERFHRNQEKL